MRWDIIKAEFEPWISPDTTFVKEEYRTEAMSPLFEGLKSITLRGVRYAGETTKRVADLSFEFDSFQNAYRQALRVGTLRCTTSNNSEIVIRNLCIGGPGLQIENRHLLRGVSEEPTETISPV